MYLTARRQFRKGDVVLVVTNPPTMPSLILRACRQRGAKCILLVHDVYPDVLLRTGTAGPSSRTVRSLDKSTRALLAGVDRVIVIGRDMKHLLESKQVPLRHPIEFIPNWADLDEVRPIPREDVPLLHELGIADRFVIQYAGNMGRTHDLETAIEAAAQLGIQSGVHFSFIGGGAKKAWLQAEVSRRENLPVSVHDFFPLARLNESLNACEVALISFLPGMGGISVPSRMYNVMAAGKPILAVTDEDSELAMVIREEQIGWVIPPGDSNALVDAINEAKSNSGKLRDMSFRARRTAEKKYALAHVIGHYQGLFRELFSED
jgi:glycosyltransferase involved in cell wall biosynthesis